MTSAELLEYQQAQTLLQNSSRYETQHSCAFLFHFQLVFVFLLDHCRYTHARPLFYVFIHAYFTPSFLTSNVSTVKM